MPSTSSTSTTLKTINPWFELRPGMNRASEATRYSIGFVLLSSVIWTDKLSLHHPLRQSGVKLYPSATVSLEFSALYPIPGIQLAKRNGIANGGKCEGGLGRAGLYYATRPSLSLVFFFFQSAAPIALFSIALHFILIQRLELPQLLSLFWLDFLNTYILFSFHNTRSKCALSAHSMIEAR